MTKMKVEKYGDHFPENTFIPLAVETYGCLESAFDRAPSFEQEV
jgi:hypothetical protein